MKCEYCDQDLMIQDSAGVGYEVWRTYSCGSSICAARGLMPRKERIQ